MGAMIAQMIWHSRKNSSASDLSTINLWSGRRESNPRH
jgi:hypothetical protein